MLVFFKKPFSIKEKFLFVIQRLKKQLLITMYVAPCLLKQASSMSKIIAAISGGSTDTLSTFC